MNSGKNILRFLIYLGVVLFQLIMTQVMTLLFSFIIPGMENFPQTNPALFSIILGITFTAGVFLAGWLAIIALAGRKAELPTTAGCYPHWRLLAVDIRSGLV